MDTKDNLYFINSFQFHQTTHELSFQDMKALSCQFLLARFNVEKSNHYLFPNRSKDISIYVVRTGSLMTELNFH
jgi:hypothetical protein